MSPQDEIRSAEIPDVLCDCKMYVEVLHAKAHLRQTDAYHVLIVICGTSICIMVMAFFSFLMLAAWYERHVTIDTAITATVFGCFTLMFGVLFGVSRKKEIANLAANLLNKD